MRKHLPFLGLLFTLALIGISSYLLLQSMWGLNHLQYLPLGYSVFLCIAAVAVGVLWRGKFQFALIGRRIELVDRLLFGRGRWPKVIVALLLCVVFYAFRLDTFLLGDGYLLLSALGQDKTHVFKWTEQGAIWLVRMVQAGLGGYSKESALTAFQILSYASGAVTVYNFLCIAQRFADDARIRLLTFVTLIGSGSMLLFFGYVEHYPVIWAAAAVFFNMALRYCDTGRGFYIVLLSFVVSVFLHLEAVSLAPAVIYLVLHKLGMDHFLFSRQTLSRVLLILAYLTSISAVLWISKQRIDFEVLFLPVLNGRPASPEYAMFSLRHLLDIVNLLFLVCPGWLALAVIGIAGGETRVPASFMRFLILSSVGSLTFLMAIDPAFGMARDWDLMSLTCLPLGLYLVCSAKRAMNLVTDRLLIAFGITAMVVTVSFVSTATNRASSETRALNLLRLYGSKNNSGWVVLSDYYYERGESDKASVVVREMRSVFGDDTLIVRGYSYLEKQKYDEAFKLAERLVKKDPYRPEYLQLLGNACGKLGRTEPAIDYYDRSIALRPYDARLRNEFGQMLMKAARYREALEALNSAREQDPSLTYALEGIGLAYFNLGFLDTASHVADTLFAMEPNQPGGHLLKMVIAIQQLDIETARSHFEQYLTYGQGRPDYERIREYYGYLTERRPAEKAGD